MYPSLTPSSPQAQNQYTDLPSAAAPDEQGTRGDMPPPREHPAEAGAQAPSRGRVSIHQAHLLELQEASRVAHAAKKAFKGSDLLQAWRDPFNDRGAALQGLLGRQVDILTRDYDAGPFKPVRSWTSYGAGKAITAFVKEPLRPEHRMLLERIEGDAREAHHHHGLSIAAARGMILHAGMETAVAGLEPGQREKWFKRTTPDHVFKASAWLEKTAPGSDDYRLAMLHALLAITSQMKRAPGLPAQAAGATPDYEPVGA